MRSRSAWKPVDRSSIRRIVSTGVVAHILYQVVFMYGLSLTSAGNSAVFMATSPLWTLFINAKLHKERIRGVMWLGMGISLIGIVSIIIGSGKEISFGGTAIFGDLICVASAMFWGLQSNLQKPLVADYSVFQLTFLLTSVGGIGLSLLAIPAAISFPWRETPWVYFLAAIASGAISIGMGNILWSNGVKRIGPGRTSNFSNLIPVLAFALAYVTLHEEVTLIQLCGVAVTIVGVAVARR
jgi:drug/metabolite transporter (DMT)-like permease